MVSTWSVDDVQQFLVDNGLNAFNPTFLEHEICGETLATLTDSDIRNSLGITILGQRRRLLAAVARQAQEKLCAQETGAGGGVFWQTEDAAVRLRLVQTGRTEKRQTEEGQCRVSGPAGICQVEATVDS